MFLLCRVKPCKQRKALIFSWVLAGFGETFGLFPGCKAVVLETYHLYSRYIINAQVTNAWSLTFTPLHQGWAARASGLYLMLNKPISRRGLICVVVTTIVNNERKKTPECSTLGLLKRAHFSDVNFFERLKLHQRVPFIKGNLPCGSTLPPVATALAGRTHHQRKHIP